MKNNRNNNLMIGSNQSLYNSNATCSQRRDWQSRLQSVYAAVLYTSQQLFQRDTHKKLINARANFYNIFFYSIIIRTIICNDKINTT